MAKDRRTKVGIGVLIAYAVLVSVATAALYELGSRPLGYVSLAELLFAPSVNQNAETQRYGHMWVHGDHPGECREYRLDNKKQQIIQVGTVICDREQYQQFTPQSRMRAIRDAFRGQQ